MRTEKVLPDPQYAAIVRERRLNTVFQPILDADTGHVIGFEALVRGPVGTRFAEPSALFGEAYRTDGVAELDWAARASACQAAIAGGLPRQAMLFLNIEPLAIDSACPMELIADIEEAFAYYPVVLEVTERSLELDPRSLLAGIDHQRRSATGLAIDDVGASPRQLPLLAVLSPDVIKLDMSVTRSHTSPSALASLFVAQEEAERTGAVLLAEGIESADHVRAAREVGARLLQGHYVGHPRPAQTPMLDKAVAFVGLAIHEPEDVDTPMQAVAGRPLSPADRRMLVALMRHVSTTAMPSSGPAMLLLHVPDAAALAAIDDGFLTAAARRGVLTVAIGPELPTPPAPDVRGGALRDPALDGAWSAVLLAPGVSAAVLARQRGDELEYAVTHDRHRVVTAARSLLRRIGPG